MGPIAEHASRTTAEMVASLGGTATPADWARIASGDTWVCPPHLKIVNTKLLQIAGKRSRGIKTNTIFAMPPRHGKSMFLSEFTPGWWLGNFPDDQVMLTAYEADFASDWGRKAQNAFDRYAPEVFGYSLDPNATAASAWGVDGKRGVMRTAGAGGALLGKGAHLLIIDDPVKNHEEAQSQTSREKLWQWWTSTVRSRREPGCATVLIMQRWHEDDLAGRFIKNALEDGDPWEVVEFKGLAEEGDILGRQPGDALWPERFTREDLELTRRVDPYWFAAQYQQDPVPSGGEFFREEWFPVVDEIPKGCQFVRYWDRAASSGKGDYTVGVLMARSKDHVYYVVDVFRDRLASAERDRQILKVAEQDERRWGCRTIRGEQEPGSSGKDAAVAFVGMLDGYDVECKTVTGDKPSRARPFAAQAKGGNVRILRNETWNRPYLAELKVFDKGKNDDQVDASSGAHNHLLSRVSLRLVTNPTHRYRGRVAS